MSKLITMDELTDLLKVSPQTVRKLMKEGSITAVKFGRVIRFEQTEVDRFIEDSKEKVIPEAAQAGE